MADWTYTLGLDSKPFVEGAKAAEAAEKQMAASIKADAGTTAAAVREQTTAMQQVSGVSVQVTQSMQNLARAATTARTELAAKAEKVRTVSQYMREMGEAGNAAKGGFANAGQGLLQASYAVDDLQYGLRGVMNNIPQVVQGLGGTAGLAGAAGIALVAFQGLASYIGNEFKKSWDWISGETERLDLEKRGEALAEAHKRKLARMVGESGQGGEREAESVGKMIESEQAFRAKRQAELDAKKAAMDADTEIARAKAEQIKGAERAIALNEIEKKATMDKLEAERQFVKERLNNLKATTGVTGDRSQDEKRLRQLQEEKRALDLVPEDERNEKQRRRAAEIGGQIQAEKTRVDYARGAYNEDSTALKKIETAIANAIKMAQAGDIRTGNTVADEKKREEDAKFAEHERVRKQQLADPNHPDNKRAEDEKKNDRRKKLQDQADLLAARISDAESAQASGGDDEDSGSGRQRGGRGMGAVPSRRIRGAILPNSYNRDRSGALRLARETKDPRINNRQNSDNQKDAAAVKLEQLRKLLADMRSELKKLNNGNAKK